MTRVLLLVLLISSAVSAQAPGSPPAPKKEECSLSGTVIRLADSQPLRRARVILRGADDRSRSVSVITDSGGHFQLKGIQPGRYQLSVSRAGFVPQEYGQKKPHDPGAVLTLRSGQEMKDLLFRLIPSAVIAGKILDEEGEPLPEIFVSALLQRYVEGRPSLSTETTAQTDDRGEYRLFGLSPGRYFVSAVFPQWGRFSRGDDEVEAAQPNQQGYAKMYYPGTPDAAKATAISIREGEEIPSVEIIMRPIGVYRIRGRVYNQITHKAGTQTEVFLMPRTKTREWGGEQRSLAQKQDGSFELADVLPGSYVLTAMWFDEGKPHITRLPIDVGNADVDGVSLTITPGTDISGQIIWEGRPSLEQGELSVMAESPDMFNFDGGSRVTSENTFVLKGLSDGTYKASLWGEGKDCYVKDVQYAGSGALEDGFTVRGGAVGTLEITLSSRGARVQGAVADSDGLPAVGVRVVLVPEPSRRTQSRLYKEQTTDQYGHFELRGIAPGDYKLFSWEEAEPGAWEDPEFLKPFDEKGEKISLQAGDQKTLNLTAIRTKTPESARP